MIPPTVNLVRGKPMWCVRYPSASARLTCWLRAEAATGMTAHPEFRPPDLFGSRTEAMQAAVDAENWRGYVVEVWKPRKGDIGEYYAVAGTGGTAADRRARWEADR